MRSGGLAASVLIAACRINFDPIGETDAYPLADAAVFTAPCDMPIQIGQGHPRLLNAAMEGTGYRVVWLDDAAAVHVIAIDRTGDAIAVRERVLPLASGFPMPTSVEIAVVGGVTVLAYSQPVSTILATLDPVDLVQSPFHGNNWQFVDIAASGAQLVVAMLMNDLFVGTVEVPRFAIPAYSQVDQMMLLSPRVAAAAGGGALVMTARPTQDDCTAWAYSGTAVLLGEAQIPNDSQRCDRMTGAYASSADQLAVGYESQGMVWALGLSASAQPVAAPVAIAPGNDAMIASSGTRFHVTYQPAGWSYYNLASMTSSLTGVNVTLLPPIVEAIDKTTVASGDGEAIAVWATFSGAIWMRRICD